MDNESTLSLFEIEGRIAILRGNIRQLTEQAAALSGAGDEARTADRIADQQATLDRLVAQRDEMLKKRQAAGGAPAAPKAPARKKAAGKKAAKPTAAAKKKSAKKTAAKTAARTGKKAAKKVSKKTSGRKTGTKKAKKK
jgi:hypothetical protein